MPPLPSNELVKTGVHCASGNVALTLPSNTKAPFAGPLVAMIVRVVPFTAMLVIFGVISRTWKRLICALGSGPVEKGATIRICPRELFATMCPTILLSRSGSVGSEA